MDADKDGNKQSMDRHQSDEQRRDQKSSQPLKKQFAPDTARPERMPPEVKKDIDAERHPEEQIVKPAEVKRDDSRFNEKTDRI